MTPVWSPQARDDLSSIRIYVGQFDAGAAQRIVMHIVHNVEDLLSRNPHMGRRGRVDGTRELVIPATPFVVPYRIVADTIQVLRVFHGAQRWPDRL